MNERYAAMIQTVMDDYTPENDEPVEPKRWLTMSAYDGKTRYISSYDTREAALEGLANEVSQGETAWFPHAMWDLDTGASFPLRLDVQVQVDPDQPLMEGNLQVPELEWTVIGTFLEDGEHHRFADTFEGASPEEAERAAVQEHPRLIVAAVLPGSVDCAA